MVSKTTVVVKTAFGFFIGGASGAVLNFLGAAHGDISKVDWHQLSMTAAGMGVITVITHYMTPPTK